MVNMFLYRWKIRWYLFRTREDRCYCDRLSTDDKNLYCIGRSFNFGKSPRPYILATRTIHWIIIIVIPANSSRKCRISYYPRGVVTYPHPLFFISQSYKRNALLISRLLAIPPTWFFLPCSPFRVTNIGWYVRGTLSIPVVHHSAYALPLFV